MRRLLRGAVLLALNGLLVAALLLGFAASRGAADPGLHGMAGVVAGGLAVASHVRRGGGLDFLVVLLLLGTIGFGTMLEGDSVTATLHLALAVPATLLSVGLHLSGLAPARGTAVVEETRG